METPDQELVFAISDLRISSVARDFPYQICKWLKEKASPKMSLKLMQTCKFFQHPEFPYMVIKKVLRIANLWILDTIGNQSTSQENLNKISKPLWLIEKLDIFPGYKAVSILLSKTAVCNVRQIQLTFQKFTLSELKHLTEGGNVEEFDMMQSSIIHDNGQHASLEEICQCLPNAKIINLGSKTPSIESLEVANAKISSRLESFTLWIHPFSFDLLKLLAYMKNHQKIHYTLWFCGISAEEYFQKFAPFVEEVVEEWSRKYKPPKIYDTTVGTPTRCFLNDFHL